MSTPRPSGPPHEGAQDVPDRRRARTRTAIGLTGLLVATGALVTLPSAQAQQTGRLSVGAAQARTCADAPARGRGVDSYRVTAPSSGLVEASVAGAGDWDLAVFDDAGEVVAASAGFTGTERATGFVQAGTPLTVQGCLVSGRPGGVTVDLSFLAITGSPESASLVSVSTPEREDKERLQELGLDLTEHADTDSVDVVLYGAQDEQVLDEAGFTFDVEVADLAAQSQADRSADAAFAASVQRTELPSGRTEYRRLADYEAELKALVAEYPRLAKPITLEEPTVEGRMVHGIEITTDVQRVHDGKPVFLHMGVHHAREWPAGEHAMEWAYELLQGYGSDAELTDLVESTRTIVVPIVNPDGFTISREAATTDTFGLFSYDNKRKNCSISANTPTAPVDYTTGTCTDNPAGRLRGTDLNRNYGGLWGGPGAEINWSGDTYRGDGPFSEPETRNIQALVASRSVTTLITNHTFGDLWLRPPGVQAVGAPLDEPLYAELGARATSHNDYANIPSYQLYDTTGGTEDWAFWTAGSLGFTPEIGTVGFHPAFEIGVVGEYLGLAPAAPEGKGGNSAAYLEMQRATADPAYHSTLTGTAPRGWTIEVSKEFLTSTSPVVRAGGVVDPPIQFEDSLYSRYDSTGGKFSFAVNPSTRPIVAGRDGREPTAPPQPGITLTNPDGVPAENPDLDPDLAQETTTFTIEEGFDNAYADLQFTWADAATDWDFYVFDSEGNEVGSAATGNQPEVLSLADPVPGEYTVMAFNYDGGDANDWAGTVGFRNPTPRVVNEPESWVLTCTDRRGTVKSVREVVVGRGETVDLGNVCVTRGRPRS
ncbi:M14 family zinc carboxypeptidase [Aquipuribacter hungaricus]|uniref:M14 family zinc carboxypeptidase n=1 Tax=Aquipuribacter hungaricus TaxID=545624 RepID=A0ABV7WJZ7_9MICO